MNDRSESPFVLGARVAIRSRYDAAGFTEDFVAKVHKPRSKYNDHGNITLKRDPKQQYRVSYWNTGGWHATQTGDAYHRAQVVPWTSEIDAEIAAALTERSRAKKQAALVDRLGRDKFTIEQIEQAEAALGIEPK